MLEPDHSTDVHHREESEGASELAHGGHNPQNIPVPGTGGGLGVRLGSDALGVHSNQWIRSFDEAYAYFLIQHRLRWLTGRLASRRSDMGNERLPQYNSSDPKDPLITAPSMRQENMEELIKKALEEDEDGDGVVERLADRIARGRKPQGRPRALKRFETT